jgi:tetratricopeptide (TPR) repeat protein
MGDRADEIDRKLDAYRAISRRLTMGFLLTNTNEYRNARLVSLDAGFGVDPNVAFMLGYDDNRRRYFERRVADYPDDANARNNLGHIYRHQGRVDEAIDLFRRAIAIEPEFANAYVNLARAYIDTKRFDEAVATLLEVRELNPTKRTLQVVNRELERIRLYRTEQYQGPSADLTLALADTYLRDGDTVTAADLMQKAIEQGETDPEIHLRLGNMYMDLEMIERAIAVFERLALSHPGHTQIEARLEDLRRLDVDRSLRQQWLNSVQIHFPDEFPSDHPSSCTEAAEAWNDYDRGGRITTDQLRRAAALFETSIDEKKDDAHAYAEAATIYEALGDYPKALAVWRRALDIAPGDTTVSAAMRRIELLASLDELNGDPGAETWLQRELGTQLILGGEFERAASHLERAVELAPEDPDLWASLGSAREGAADFEGAIEAFETALRLETDDLRRTALERRLAQVRSRSDTATSGT